MYAGTVMPPPVPHLSRAATKNQIEKKSIFVCVLSYRHPPLYFLYFIWFWCGDMVEQLIQ